MGIVAYDTKRDSEVTKTITVITMVYIPATFTCLRSRTLQIDHWGAQLMVLNVDDLQYGVL